MSSVLTSKGISIMAKQLVEKDDTNPIEINERITFSGKSVFIIIIACASLVGIYWDSKNADTKLAAADSAIIKEVSSLRFQHESDQLASSDRQELILIEMQEMNSKIASLILLATFRTDPWSGEMQIYFQEQWFQLMESQGTTVKQSDRPDIKEIQRIHAANLIPDGFFEAFGVKDKY